jgi:hypothetical protein
MSSEPSPSPGPAPADIAEQILQRIYGDDFAGCNVDPNDVAAIIDVGLKAHQQRSVELLDLYDKVVEAIELLSTPPDPAKVTDPAELSKILSERLDAIRTVTTKTRETVARFKANTPL